MFNHHFFIKKKTFTLIAAIFLSVAFLQAQDDSSPLEKDEQLIRQKIEMYFEGWLTGDTLKIGRAMHSTCKLKNIKEGKVVVFDRAKYLSFFKPRPKLENAGGKIINIDITANIASAKCELETKTKLFTDYFNLMKVKDEWFIVDKIATNRLKEGKE